MQSKQQSSISSNKMYNKFTIEQAMKAQRRNRGMALSLTSALDGGWVVNATPWPLYLRERDLVPIVWEAEWAPRPVWKGAENLAPPPKWD